MAWSADDGLLAQVVSCEMIEAVGHENLPIYFQAISGFLKPGGQAVIQVCCFHDVQYALLHILADLGCRAYQWQSTLLALQQHLQRCSAL